MGSIQNIWDAINRWKKRYLSVSSAQNSGLHLWRHYELGKKPIISPDKIKKRIIERIQFFNDYFVNTSFDGPEFMEAKGLSNLSYNYPSRCNDAWGIWLSRSKENTKHFSGPHFSSDQVSVFVKKIESIDFASMYSIMQFNHIYIRMPRGKRWDENGIKSIGEVIQCDLDFDAIGIKVAPIKFDGELAYFNIEEIGKIDDAEDGKYSGLSKGAIPAAPLRQRAARSDASIESIQKIMEQTFSLPKGSVKLFYPNGRKAKSNVSVGSLKLNWEKYCEK